MIVRNPKFKKNSFSVVCHTELKNIENSAYVSIKVLEYLFNIFTWVYDSKSIANAFVDEPKIEAFFKTVDIKLYLGKSPIYSAIVLYNKLNKLIDMRKFEQGVVVEEACKNKQFLAPEFVFKEVYEEYVNSSFEFGRDFLLFNEIFLPKRTYRKAPLVSLSDSLKLSKTELILPTFKYKLATKKFSVNIIQNDVLTDTKTLFVIQDVSYSMSEYVKALYFIKAFILKEAFVNGYEVTWLGFSNKEYSRDVYTPDNVQELVVEQSFFSGALNYTSILCSTELQGKEILLITDGTDTFDVPKTVSFKTLNVISFTENKSLKTKISKYGRFFKIKNNE